MWLSNEVKTEKKQEWPKADWHLRSPLKKKWRNIILLIALTGVGVDTVSEGRVKKLRMRKSNGVLELCQSSTSISVSQVNEPEGT